MMNIAIVSMEVNLTQVSFVVTSDLFLRLQFREEDYFTLIYFGLSNATQTQQKLIDAVFGPEPHIFLYPNDIFITSKTFEEHIRLLLEVPKRLHYNI